MTRCLWLLVLCLPALVHGEDSLGRLFTTPEQRHALDQPVQISRPQTGETRRVQAVFRRAGAEPVALIAGMPVRAGQVLYGGVRVLAIDDTGVELRVPGRAPVTLAPGSALPSPGSGPAP